MNKPIRYCKDQIEQARRDGAYWAGVRDGFHEGATIVLREVFRIRFGDQQDELAQAIAHSDWPRWDDVLKHITTDSVEQLRARLGL